MSGDRTFRRRLLHTPLRDLCRGRITGRADLAGVFDSAALPDPLADLVRRVSRRTRLDRVERVDVARDLAEHFRDGLSAGTDEATLVRDFGDERAAARLLRRSMLRKRPAWRRAQRRLVQATLITVASVVGIYLLAAVRYWSQRPVIRTDYIAQLNSPIVAVPESDRSWPRIRAAMNEVRSLVEPPDRPMSDSMPEGAARDQVINRVADSARLATIEPWSGPDEEAMAREALDEDTPDAEAIAALFDRVEPALAELRAAAALPSLGREVGSGLPSDPEDIAFFGMESRVGPARTDWFANSVVAIELPHYNTLRSAARLLATDARRAIAAGEGVRAVDDLAATLELGRQVREPSFLIGQLVAIAIEQLAFDVVLDAMATRPDALTDADLARLAATIGALDGERLAMDLAGERLFFEDLAQRFYTDDGDGNGVLTLRAAEDLGPLTLGGAMPVGDLPSTLGFLVTPALANLALDRRSALQIWNEFFDVCEQAVATPPWSLDRTALGTIDGRPMEETADGWRNRLRYFPLNLLVPAIDKAILAGLAVQAQRDLVETVVAIERARRREGDWPRSLDAIPNDLLTDAARDPFDGEPIRYAVVEGVPTIWTIGPNRTDDGGQAIEDRRDRARGSRLIESPASLATLSEYWGADQPAERELDGDIVVWRGR